MKTIEGFIEYQPATYEGETEYRFHPVKMPDYGYVCVMPFTVEFELPEGFDPREKMVEMLQEKKRELMADFQNSITKIDAQISKYLALEAA